MEEFLEKHYDEKLAASDEQVIRLAIRGLMEVVQSSAKNIEIAVLRRNQPMEVWPLLVSNSVNTLMI